VNLQNLDSVQKPQKPMAVESGRLTEAPDSLQNGTGYELWVAFSISFWKPEIEKVVAECGSSKLG